MTDIPKFKGDDKVDKSSLSYIRGRYGAGSKEYINAVLAHNKCFSGTPLREGGTTSVPNGRAAPGLNSWGTIKSTPGTTSVKRKAPEPVKRVEPKKEPEIVEFNASELINSMSAEDRRHKEPEPLVRREGESVLDFAKRKREHCG